jgi:Arm DNA-binding domain
LLAFSETQPSWLFTPVCWYPAKLLVYLLVSEPRSVGDTNMPLKDVSVRNAKAGSRPRKLSDGGGLHVLIQPTGSKLWRLAYRFAGKQKTLALGVYPTVSLEEARRHRDEAKKLLARSIDPSVQRKADRHAGKDSTFRAVAGEVIAKLEREGRAQATLNKRRWLLDFAFPAFGDRPIAEITARELLALLRQIEGRGLYETASGSAVLAAWFFGMPLQLGGPSVIHPWTFAVR